MRTNGDDVLGMSVKAGAAAGVFALLLVGWIMVTKDTSEPLTTDALLGPTTTLMPSSTTSPDTLEPQTSGPPTTRSSLETSDDYLDGLPRSLVAGGDAINGAADAGVTETTVARAAGPAPVRIPRPLCAASLGAASSRTAPFTGLTASIPSNMPAVLVKVSNNSSKSRAALIGIDQADIVFEERIEASATRFAAVFHSSLPSNVGPVRSGRTTDIQITQNLNRPVMGYSGSNAGVAAQIKFAADNGLVVPYVNNDSAPFARDSRYSAPDNLFVDPVSLGACGGGGNPTPIFSYGPASSTTAQPASSVSMQARSPYRFDWNGTGWTRSQDGYTHTTRTGAAIAPSNVVVLFVPYVPSAIDSASVDAQTIGSGNAWVFRDGTITQGSWTRAKGHEPYTLIGGNGTQTTLAPGQTWVVLAPAGTASWG